MAPGGADDDVDANHELMVVTGRALAKYGIAELTTQRIADEWGKSQALVHYYYETKEDLLVGYVEWLRKLTEENYADHADDPPIERVRWLLFRHFQGPHDPSEPEFSTGLVELQAGAPYNERLRRALIELDDAAIEFLEAALRDGIEAGDFRDVDVDAVVRHLLAWLSGTIQRSATLGRTLEPDVADSAMTAYLEEMLLADDRE